MLNKILILVIFTLAIPVAPARAHHSFAAQYDASKPLKLRGAIAKVDWVNPHAWLYLDVGNVRWMVETGSPGVLMRQGFTKETLVPGTPIIVEGYPAKSGEHKIMSTQIRFAL